MKVQKTFVRNGQRFRPGDDVPADADKQTITKYKALGMVGDAPAVKSAADQKPATRRVARQTPQNNQAAGPGSTQSVGPLTTQTAKPDLVKPAGPTSDLPGDSTGDSDQETPLPLGDGSASDNS